MICSLKRATPQSNSVAKGPASVVIPLDDDDVAILIDEEESNTLQNNTALSPSSSSSSSSSSFASLSSTAPKTEHVIVNNDYEDEYEVPAVCLVVGVSLTEDEDEDEDEDVDAIIRSSKRRKTGPQSFHQTKQSSNIRIDTDSDSDENERRAKEEENKNDFFDVLSEHRTNIENFVNKHWIEQMGKIIEIKENPHSLPGTPQYNRFVEEWQKVADQTVKCVFHGTPEANIDAICLGGLDPSRRGKNGQAHGAGEYFADEPAICLAYCKGGKKMLVFAVLLDRSGFTANKVTVINNTAHQLPLFIVTFQNPMGLVRPAEGWKVGVASMAGMAGMKDRELAKKFKKLQGVKEAIESKKLEIERMENKTMKGKLEKQLTKQEKLKNQLERKIKALKTKQEV